MTPKSWGHVSEKHALKRKIYDSESGRNRLVWALIVTLGFSRHQYVHVSFSQKLDVVIDGLEDAWEFFGGVPLRVVVDNMKTAVVKSDRYEPSFQRTTEQYAEHRGFVIDPAVPRHPTGKPIVERGVQYVRESFFRGEQWLDLVHLQREARRWCMEVAGRRNSRDHSKTPSSRVRTSRACLPSTRERASIRYASVGRADRS